MKINYCFAEKDDLEKLIAFLSHQDINFAFVRPLSERTISIAERVYSKYKKGCWLLAKAQSEIAGCLALIPQKEEVEISTFAVSPVYKGQGIGATLIDKAIETTQEKYSSFNTLILDSWEGNVPIAKLMEKKNFRLREAYEDLEKRPLGIKTLVYEIKLN